MEPKKKSLMERYGVTINQLDFSYIKECKDSRKVEKIVQILRSGEEGYFPDLTKCAEDKLRELKPNSRHLQTEQIILKSNALPAEELKPIYDWNQDIKNTDQQLKSSDTEDIHTAPIRNAGSISLTPEKLKKTESKQTPNVNKENKRISSTDYSKWDKYDADVEVLRIELEEERKQESIEIKNRRNKKIYNTENENTFKQSDIEKNKTLLNQLNDIEKDKLAEGYRLCGNEYFRAKEYSPAKKEYTKSIEINPKKAIFAYSNRALCNIKMQLYKEAIEDCELCLQLDPENIKARLRLAEATRAWGKKKESYDLFLKVLDVDKKNAMALKALEELREEFADIPPLNATRLQIEEIFDEPEKAKSQTDVSTKAKPDKVVKAHPADKVNITEENTKIDKTTKKVSILTEEPDYNLSELVKPDYIVKNKFSQFAENISKGFQATKPSVKKQQPIRSKQLLIEEL